MERTSTTSARAAATPGSCSETYRWYVTLQNPGVAAALALVVLVLSMVTSVVYLRTLRSEEVR